MNNTAACANVAAACRALGITRVAYASSVTVYSMPELASVPSTLQGMNPVISIEKARRLVGYEPRYSWQTEIGAIPASG